MPRIIAYSLCYNEAALLSASIRWIYDLVDEFRVVIGSADDRLAGHPWGAFHQEPDKTSRAVLQAMPDPEKKLRIMAESPSWGDKQYMTDAATQNLKGDILLHLDADEFWPHETLKASIEAVLDSPNRAAPGHVLYWGTCEYLCESETGSSVWFKPPRVMTIQPNGMVRHMYPVVLNPSGKEIGNVVPISGKPVWHAAWTGQKRMERKRRFYAEGRRKPMFSPAQLAEWWKDKPTPFGPLDINVGRMKVMRTAEYFAPPSKLAEQIEEASV